MTDFDGASCEWLASEIQTLASNAHSRLGEIALPLASTPPNQSTDEWRAQSDRHTNELSAAIREAVDQYRVQYAGAVAATIDAALRASLVGADEFLAERQSATSPINLFNLDDAAKLLAVIAGRAPKP